MKCIHLSDTHSRHKQIYWPFDPANADMIIHSGDFSNVGEIMDVSEFFQWFSNLPIKYKIITAGNHDKCFDPKFWDNKALTTDRYRKVLIGAKRYSKQIIDNFTSNPNHFFLNHEAVVIEGIKFFGTPWSKSFHAPYWAFNVNDGEEAKKLYDTMPDDVDVLISHGPAYGKLDLTKMGVKAGSIQLAERIRVVNPSFVLTGHIHEDYGQLVEDGITYLNGSILDSDYLPTNIPHVFEINKR